MRSLYPNVLEIKRSPCYTVNFRKKLSHCETVLNQTVSSDINLWDPPTSFFLGGRGNG